jgi:hypothetical protein
VKDGVSREQARVFKRFSIFAEFAKGHNVPEDVANKNSCKLIALVD